ncbi:MAG: winged helix-turn-helix transcriptional regulator [Pseudomonadota bacterium]
MEVFHKRWHLRVLAFLHQHHGARFVEFGPALGISADSLTRALQELQDAGWVMRNPGYGHPLRPEYVLTERATALAAQCARFAALISDLGAGRAVYHKWSVPVIVTIDGGIARFNALKQTLAITPRALQQSLQRLADTRLVTDGDGYALTTPGAKIATLANRVLVQHAAPGG